MLSNDPAALGQPPRRTPPAEPPAQAPPEDAPAAETPPAPETPTLLPAIPLEPLGHSGPTGGGEWIRREAAVPTPDRWRLGWFDWDRYGRRGPHDDLLMNAVGGDSPYTRGHAFNPYDRNILKGDYPIAGDDLFFNFTAISEDRKSVV